ncbi:MAG: hypothetical protein ACFFED_01585 [Candidatus Thorarchaeota archaeon]
MLELLLNDKEYLILASISIVVCFIVMALFGDPNHWTAFIFLMLVYGLVLIGGRIGYNYRLDYGDAPYSD